MQNATKNSPNNSTSTPQRSYDTMQNNYNRIFLTLSFSMPSDSNNTNTLKDSDNEKTNENELIENVLDSIDFDAMSSEEEQNTNSDSDSVDFEGCSESNESNVMLITELMISEILELLSTMHLHRPKISKRHQNIEDKFSSILGDRFHHMHRATLSTNHCYKKIFFASL